MGIVGADPSHPRNCVVVSSWLTPIFHRSCVTARHVCAQELVDRTRAHPSFAKSFSFNTNSSWVEARACGDGCDALPQVVALDCEMSVSEVRPWSATISFSFCSSRYPRDICAIFWGGREGLYITVEYSI